FAAAVVTHDNLVGQLRCIQILERLGPWHLVGLLLNAAALVADGVAGMSEPQDPIGSIGGWPVVLFSLCLRNGRRWWNQAYESLPKPGVRWLGLSIACAACRQERP